MTSQMSEKTNGMYFITNLNRNCQNTRPIMKTPQTLHSKVLLPSYRACSCCRRSIIWQNGTISSNICKNSQNSFTSCLKKNWKILKRNTMLGKSVLWLLIVRSGVGLLCGCARSCLEWRSKRRRQTNSPLLLMKLLLRSGKILKVGMNILKICQTRILNMFIRNGETRLRKWKKIS